METLGSCSKETLDTLGVQRERVEKDPGYVRRTRLPDMQALGAAGAHTPPAHSTSKERGEQGGTAVAPSSSRSGEWGM